MKFRVIFVQNWEFDVDAEDEAEAEDKAGNEFFNIMHQPYAHTHYDDCIVDCLEEEEIY